MKEIKMGKIFNKCYTGTLNQYINLKEKDENSLYVVEDEATKVKAIYKGDSKIAGDFVIIEGDAPPTDIQKGTIYYITAFTNKGKQTAAPFIGCYNGTVWQSFQEGYLKTDEGDKRYVPKGSGSSSSGSAISISTSGSFNNFGNNGQAFNAVRDLTGTTKYQTATGSGFPLNAASFGVKDNGTTAFSHKKYDTFNKDTGAATGAKNTAVLVFSGKSGFLYAKNTGSASDVTEDMYKYVGVIDSPDEKQRVYSKSQTDAQITALIENALAPIVQNFNDQINDLKTRVENLERRDDGETGIEGSGRDIDITFDMINQIQNETDEMLRNLPQVIEEAIENATEPPFEVIPNDGIETDV